MKNEISKPFHKKIKWNALWVSILTNADCLKHASVLELLSDNFRREHGSRFHNIGLQATNEQGAGGGQRVHQLVE